MRDWFSKLDTMRRAFIGLSAFYILFVGYKFLSYYLPTSRAIQFATSGGDVSSLYETDPDLFYAIANLSEFDAKVTLYESLLIWGLVAIAIIGFFLFFKSGRATK